MIYVPEKKKTANLSLKKHKNDNTKSYKLHVIIMYKEKNVM